MKGWGKTLCFYGLTTLSLSAVGQVSEFTLTDNLSTYSERNLFGGRFGASSGFGAFSVRGQNSPLQNWWWYRAGSDEREFALSNQVAFEQLNPNQVQLTYDEPVTAIGENALRFFVNYELNQLDTGHARVFIGFAIVNLTSQTIPVNFFSYLDADLGGTALDDSAFIEGDDSETQKISDTRGLISMNYTASTRRLVAYEMTAYPSLVDSLSDGVLDNLTNSGSPFGPGDYSGAFQWQVDLTPGEITFIGSVTKEIVVVPEPGTLGVLAFSFLAMLRRKKSS